jgi:hypothetical protein
MVRVRIRGAGTPRAMLVLTSDHSAMFRLRAIWNKLLSRLQGATVAPRTIVPVSPPLRYLAEAVDTAWLSASMTTFGQSVASFLPAEFEAYARVYHMLQRDGDESMPSPGWRALAAADGIDLCTTAGVTALLDDRRSGFWVEEGSLTPSETSVLIEHLGPATRTEGDCRFAVWHGFGDTLVPHDVPATLVLPGREYHMFSGPIDGAKVNLSVSTMTSRSANLWWPADHAWCVATEIDFPWTYVGGSRACINLIVDDGRLDAHHVDVRAPR